MHIYGRYCTKKGNFLAEAIMEGLLPKCKVVSGACDQVGKLGAMLKFANKGNGKTQE